MSEFELRLALVGWGAIARQVAALLSIRQSPVTLVAVAVRDAGAARDGFPPSCARITEPAALAQHQPDLVIEAAGRGAVAAWGRAALGMGADFAVSSTSAFVDADLLTELTALAKEKRAQLIIPPGALGGIDALSAAARMPLTAVHHRIVKPAKAWAGTRAESLCDLATLTEPFTFFEGPADQAADLYPQNANVAVISALAGIGMARTVVAMVADPAAQMNSHSLQVEGAFGRFQITLDNRALPENPKSSAMTALSLVRMIENRAGPLVI